MRRREDPTHTFLYLSSTFDQTLMYSLLFSSLLFYLSSLSHSIFPSSYTSSPQIHPPTRTKDSKKQKISRTIRRLRLSPSICRKAKENTSIAINQTRIRLQKIHQLVNAEKKRKKKKEKENGREKKIPCNIYSSSPTLHLDSILDTFHRLCYSARHEEKKRRNQY